MSTVLLRILLLSIRGRFVRWIRMLRQPKYLVGFVVGVAYVGFWITHSAFQNRGPFFAGRGAAFGGDLAPLLQVDPAAEGLQHGVLEDDDASSAAVLRSVHGEIGPAHLHKANKKKSGKVTA